MESGLHYPGGYCKKSKHPYVLVLNQWDAPKNEFQVN
jgi:hypothetical protein